MAVQDDECAGETDRGAGALFAGPGDVRARCRALDWAATPLGAVETWPEALRSAVRLSLDSGFPMCVYAGPEFVVVYNEGFVAALGPGRHPQALGRPAREVWPEIWDRIAPEFARVSTGGPPIHVHDRKFLIEREGNVEETFWTYAFAPLRTKDASVVGIHAVATETTAHVRAEASRRESEQRQAFLLALSDALRPLADAVEIQRTAIDHVAAYFGVEMAAYIEFGPDGDRGALRVGHAGSRIPFPPEVRLSDFGAGVVDELRAGRTFAHEDAETDPRLASHRDAFRALNVRSGVGIPLIKAGRLAAALAINHTEPRRWTEPQLRLLKDVAERIWTAVERASAEAALRDSRDDYRTLFTEMDQGFCIIEKVETPPGAPVDFRYVVANPAFERHTGMHDVVGRTIRELVPDGEEGIFRIYDNVVVTGERTLFEDYVAALDMWMSAEVFPAPIPGQISVLFSNISARKRAELALRASEERQAFLLTLSDALAELGDASEILETAARLLGDHLRTDRTIYGEIEGEAGARECILRAQYVRQGSSLPPRVDYEALARSWVGDQLRRGVPVVVSDTASDPRLDDALRAGWLAADMRALVAVALTRNGREAVTFGVHQVVSRSWMASEVELVTEVAQRTWAAAERARAEAALRTREQRFRALVSAGAVSIYRMSPDWRIMHQLDSWQFLESTGEPIEEWADHYILPGDRDQVSASIQQAIATRSPFELEHRVQLADGSIGWVISRAVPLFGRDGEIVEWFGAGTDVSARKRAEASLRETETRYRTLIDNVLDYAIILLDANGFITEWTPGAERVKGYTAEEALGRHFGIFYPAQDRDRGLPEHELARAAEDGRAENEGWRVRKDGTRFWADEILTPVHDHAGAVVGFTKICRDLTHRMLVEAAAERQRQERERDDFRRQLAAAEENERRRIARELHDQLGQHLAALSLGLDEARRMMSDGNGATERGALRAAMRLQTLQELASTMTDDARNLALELRPPELDDVGLASALETYVSRWAARTRIAADLEASGIDRTPVVADVGTAIYRIVQEALTNIVKHAAAEHVSVIVERTHAGIQLIVEDDGQGFDADATMQRARAQARLGIAGMRERATLVGGTLTVESERGTGTTIYVTIPEEVALAERIGARTGMLDDDALASRGANS